MQKSRTVERLAHGFCGNSHLETSDLTKGPYGSVTDLSAERKDRKGETDKVDEPARLADCFCPNNRHVAFGHDIGDGRVEDDDARDACLCQDRVGLEAQAELHSRRGKRDVKFMSRSFNSPAGSTYRS